MRIPALTLLTVTFFSLPLHAQKAASPKPVVSPPAPAAVFVPALAIAQKIRTAQKTLKPTQIFARTSSDPRHAPSLEFNEALLKVITSPTATNAQKRGALKIWDDFYRESQVWKPYYFIGTFVPKETMVKMRDFSLAELQVARESDANQLAKYFSTFAIFAYDHEWEQSKAGQLLAESAKGPLREWAMQIRMNDKRVPLAERLRLYRELIALPKPVLNTRDNYFTSFNVGLRSTDSEEKSQSAQLQKEVFESPLFSASTRFGAALNLSVQTTKPSEKIAIYDRALRLSGLELSDNVSLLHWKGQAYTDLKDYPNALRAWDAAARQAGEKLPRQRAEARFAAVRLYHEVLKKPTDARPLLELLAGDENMNSLDVLQVVLWRTDMEANSGSYDKAAQILDSGLALKKLDVNQRNFLRFQLAQIRVLQRNHAAGIEIIKQIPARALASEVEFNGFNSMFGNSMSLKNYDGAKAVLDLWAQRGGIDLANYALLNGLVFESRGDLAAALAIYKAVLTTAATDADKVELNAAIARIEARIAATAKPETP